MEQKFHYATVTDAINQLRAKGFNLDFNLEKNGVKVGEHEFTADEIEIESFHASGEIRALIWLAA